MSNKLDLAKSFLTPEEKKTITSSLCCPWQKIYVQSGKISNKDLVEPHVYSVGCLIVQTINSKVLITLDTENFNNEIELFRLAITFDELELGKMLSKMHPPIQEIYSYPIDLNLDNFLNVDNEISLLRFNSVHWREGRQINITTESGMLIKSNSTELLLYPNEEIPLDLCITKNTQKIQEIIKSATIANLT